MGVAAEDPVDPLGIEPERDELALDVGDVVAPQHGLAEVEEPIAEGEPALHERGPGVPTDFPVNLEPPRYFWNARTARGGAGTEYSKLVGIGAMADPGKPKLEIADGSPRVPVRKTMESDTGGEGRPPQLRRRTRPGPGGAALCPWRRRVA